MASRPSSHQAQDHRRGPQADPLHERQSQFDPNHGRETQIDPHHLKEHQFDPHLLYWSVPSSYGRVTDSSGGGGVKGGCGRCGQAFSIFFNKRVRCGGGCGVPVCRRCAPWSAASNTHLCGVCCAHQSQEQQSQSEEQQQEQQPQEQSQEQKPQEQSQEQQPQEQSQEQKKQEQSQSEEQPQEQQPQEQSQEQQPQFQEQEEAAEPTTPNDGDLRQVDESFRSHLEDLVEGREEDSPYQVTPSTTTHPHPTLLDLNKISEHTKWDLLLYYYCFCYGEQEVPADGATATATSAAEAVPADGATTTTTGGSVAPEDLPAARHARHAHLTHLLKNNTMILPRQMEGYDPAVSPETPVEDFNSHTYEDILATAILNKVLESCEGGRPNEVTIEVSHDVTSTDTDSGMSGGAKESHRGRRKRGEVSEAGSEGSEERSLTPPHHPDQRPPTVSPDQGVVTDDCWASAVTGDGAPLQFKIEEHVEEITTHRLTDDDDQDLDCAYDNDVSDSGGSWRGSRCSLDDSRETRHHKVSHHSVTEDPLLSTINVALPDPAHISDRRVSFPELGADIIHDVDCCDVGPGDMVLNSDTWEENWLFRRQRLMGASASDPVTMLIPNPEAHVPATVGNRDIDELSELSEQQSIGSGEPWSMSESDGEGECMKSCQPSTASRELSTLAGEIVAEFAQQDQEYTVDYSVPIRVTATCRAQQSRKHLASPQASPTHSHKSPEAQPSTRFIYTNHKGVLRNYHEGKTVEGVKNPGVAEKSQVDLDFVSDNERPVPKPRKLSLATKSSTNTSANSSVQLLLSPAEDLTILSPPLEVPDPSNTSSKSETVWFVETPEDCVVMQGRTLRLACQVNTKKPMGVSWYHNGSLVAVGGRDQWVYRQGPFYHLHVYGMTSVAAGLYATAAYTATNCVWAFCRVQYKANSRPQKRPTFTKGLSDVILEEGGDLYLQCQVQGHPEPRVIFSRGLERLEPSSRLAIESDQYGTWTLRLAECSASDSGEITATAASMLSAVNTHCRVKVVPEGTPIPQQVHTNSARLQPSALQTNKQGNTDGSSRSFSEILRRCFFCCCGRPRVDDSTPLLLQS